MAGARMQDIADEAGINKALLHYYFRSKEELFDRIFQEALSKFFPKVAEILSSSKPLFEKIEKFCIEYIEMLKQDPYLPLFVLNEVNKRPVRFKEKFWHKREPLYFIFVTQVDNEVRSNKIKPVNPAHLFVNMISMCIFPFVAKPMLMIASGMDEWQFGLFIEQRKTEIHQFIIDSIKK